MYALYWLFAALVFLVLEIMTMGLTTIWFAGGALIAALLALIGLPLFAQVIAFGIVSLILLLVTKPLASRYLNNKTVRTNVDSLIGQKCIVTKKIDNLHAHGEVSVKGQAWTARSVKEDEIIPENSIVKVESISGVKLMVSLVSENQFMEEQI